MPQSSNEVAVSTSKDSSTPEVEASELGGEPLGVGSPKELSPRIDALDDPTSADLAVEAGELAPPAREDIDFCETSDTLDASTPTPQDVSNGERSAATVGGNATAPNDAFDAIPSTHTDSGTEDTATTSTVVGELLPAIASPLPSKAYLPAVISANSAVNSLPAVVPSKFCRIPVIGRVEILNGQDGYPYLIDRSEGNPLGVRIGTKVCDALVRKLALEAGKNLNRIVLNEINDNLEAEAINSNSVGDVWYRVAPTEGGVILDVGDQAQTRLKVTGSGIETIRSGCEVVFRRVDTMRPFPSLADAGDINLLKKYTNVSDSDRMLLIAWLTYTLTRPKESGNNYVFLVVQGDKGSGKSILCRDVIMPLVDASSVSSRTLTHSAKDLGIISDNSHVASIDNVRNFNSHTSDLLCQMSTGGALSGRALYSNSSQHVDRLHGALILNGIHSFIVQSDLADRCLIIHTKPIGEERRTNVAIFNDLQEDLPKIFRGLLEYTVRILNSLPSAKISMPERMLDFVEWLAAMEAADGLTAPAFQIQYSDSMRQHQLDSLLDNSLAAAIIDLSDKTFPAAWSGTPNDLFHELNEAKAPTSVQRFVPRSHDWPENPIALSKRLIGLKAALLGQGISIEFSRGKQRRITIRPVKTKALHDA